MKQLVLLLALALCMVGCKNSETSSKDSGSTVSKTEGVKATTEKKPVEEAVYSEDKEINAAIIEARKTLPEFYKRLAAPQDGDNGFSLKVKMKDENGEEELWFSNIEVVGDSLVGVLSNKPVTVTSLKPGEKKTIVEDDIRDWMYFEYRKMIGNKTVYPMIKSLSPRDAYLMKQKLGIE